MRRLRITNEGYNTPSYFDDQFKEKIIDMEHTLRQDKYLSILQQHNVKSVVELGCGMSSFLPKASLLYEDVCGLDFAPDTIARLSADYPSICYEVGDATATPYDDQVFDAVVAGEIIEHLEVPVDLVKEMARICKKGGIMLLSTPQLEIDDPEHLWELDAGDLAAMFSDYGTPHVETIESERFPGRKYLFVWTKREF